MSLASRVCFAAFLAVATLLVGRGRAEACSCAGDEPPEVALERADAVFVAKIASIERRQRHQVVQLTVTRAFKGVTTGASITIHTGAGGGDCGVPFSAASSWLVYASHADRLLYDDEPGYPGLRTIPCGRTTPMDSAKTDIDALVAATSAKAKTPATPASEDPPVPSATTSAEPAPMASTQAPTDASTPAPTSTPIRNAPRSSSKGCAFAAGTHAFGFQVGLVAFALFVFGVRRSQGAESSDRQQRKPKW